MDSEGPGRGPAVMAIAGLAFDFRLGVGFSFLSPPPSHGRSGAGRLGGRRQAGKRPRGGGRAG